MPKNPDTIDKAPSQLLQMFFVAFCMFTLIITGIYFLVPKMIAASIVQEGETYYKDEGKGIMVINSSNQEMIKKAFAQWKNDFPQRAENMLEVKMDGCYRPYFMIIYQD